MMDFMIDVLPVLTHELPHLLPHSRKITTLLALMFPSSDVGPHARQFKCLAADTPVRAAVGIYRYPGSSDHATRAGAGAVAHVSGDLCTAVAAEGVAGAAPTVRPSPAGDHWRRRGGGAPLAGLLCRGEAVQCVCGCHLH